MDEGAEVDLKWYWHSPARVCSLFRICGIAPSITTLWSLMITSRKYPQMYTVWRYGICTIKRTIFCVSAQGKGSGRRGPFAEGDEVNAFSRFVPSPRPAFPLLQSNSCVDSRRL